MYPRADKKQPGADRASRGTRLQGDVVPRPEVPLTRGMMPRCGLVAQRIRVQWASTRVCKTWWMLGSRGNCDR